MQLRRLTVARAVDDYAHPLRHRAPRLRPLYRYRKPEESGIQFKGSGMATHSHRGNGALARPIHLPLGVQPCSIPHLSSARSAGLMSFSTRRKGSARTNMDARPLPPVRCSRASSESSSDPARMPSTIPGMESGRRPLTVDPAGGFRNHFPRRGDQLAGAKTRYLPQAIFTILRRMNAICVASGRFLGHTSWQASSDMQPKTPSSSPMTS